MGKGEPGNNASCWLAASARLRRNGVFLTRMPHDGVAKLLEVVTRRIPARFGSTRSRTCRCLPMNRGGLGARSLNLELQRLLNLPGAVRVERFGSIFGPGDKVMQIANDYDKEVFNGDLGLVEGD